MLEHLFLLLEKSDLKGLLGFWNYLDIKFFSRLEARFAKSVKKFELSLLRYYLVYAIQHNRRDKVTEFFELLTPELTGNSDWTLWFCMSTTSTHFPTLSHHLIMMLSANFHPCFLLLLLLLLLKALPFVKRPEVDPNFELFFTKQWFETFLLSLQNFLTTIFQSMRECSFFLSLFSFCSLLAS